ncbi:MAG: rhomboid family intramembrane serine protease [Pseudomonadota bacterium]
MASLDCPQCHHHLLEPIHYEGIEIDACMHCGGLWFDHNELDKVIRKYYPDYPREDTIIKTLGQEVDGTPKQCPHCKDSLKTYQFEQGSELKIDICQSYDGIWLEQGELDHAKRFYEKPSRFENISKKYEHWIFQFLFYLPVEFNLKPRNFPLITVILIVLNGLIFTGLFISLFRDPELPEKILYQWGLIPEEIGAFKWFVALLTHQFLHGGWGHLIGNMYFLYILGDNVEDAMGRIRFLLFYIFCGLVAAITHVGYELTLGVSANLPSIGASGAVSGVMAAYAYIFRKAKLTFMFVILQYKLAPVWYFSLWLGINVLLLIYGVQGVSWAAHIGGFIAGLVFSYFVYERILTNNPLIRYMNQGYPLKALYWEWL